MAICVIGCIFGKKYKAVYPSVNNCDSYFFSNNPEIQEAVERAGWKYVFVDLPLSDDDAISSFQSKYVKFLQFLKDKSFGYFRNYDMIVYTDHKLELKDEQVEYLLSKISNKKIIVIEHFQSRKNIWVEVGESMFQERYLRFMPQTIDYIMEKTGEGYSEQCIIVLTGLIVYKHLEIQTIEFTDKIYKDLEKIGTSQCQIIWSIIGQKYTDIIKILKWNELKLNPKEPKGEKDGLSYLNGEQVNSRVNIEEFLTEIVAYLKQELRNKSAHLDLLKRSENCLAGEIQNKTEKIKRLKEDEVYLKRELQNKTTHIERLILTERRLETEINDMVSSRSWKIASKISVVLPKNFGRL